MGSRHPLRAGIAAALVPLVAIAVFGNSWFTEHVRFDGNHSRLVDRFLITIGPFVWTVTPRRGRGAGTLWWSQALGILTVVLGVLLVVWLIARHASGLALLLGAWGMTIAVAMVGAFVTVFISYGVLFGSADVDGLGRFWHSVFQSQQVALWGALVGLPTGLIALLLAGGVERPAPYVTSAPLPGGAWAPAGQPMYATQPVPAAQPAYGTQPMYGVQPTYAEPPTIVAPQSAPSAPAPYMEPAPMPRPPGDPTVVMVPPGEWGSPAPAPPVQRPDGS